MADPTLNLRLTRTYDRAFAELAQHLCPRGGALLVILMAELIAAAEVAVREAREEVTRG